MLTVRERIAIAPPRSASESRNYPKRGAPAVGAVLELPRSMLTILVILLILALLGGGLGSRSVGAWGWSPAGIIILILIIMALTGRL